MIWCDFWFWLIKNVCVSVKYENVCDDDIVYSNLSTIYSWWRLNIFSPPIVIFFLCLFFCVPFTTTTYYDLRYKTKIMIESIIYKIFDVYYVIIIVRREWSFMWSFNHFYVDDHVLFDGKKDDDAMMLMVC